jgi:L-2-hydroxyglutarate oxidase LhgO
MPETPVTIIGAGVVGLAIARELAQRVRGLLVIEKHDGFGRETSSRNSEVIHAGMYYPTDTLKARLCVDGNAAMYELCAAQGIPHRRCGKIIVANTGEEEEKIGRLLDLGRLNGVAGLRMLTEQEVRGLEPDVRCRCGLWSPSTGILSSHDLMRFFERTAESNGAVIAYDCEVVGLRRGDGAWLVDVRDVDARIETIASETVINAAGLWADGVAAMAGIDIDAAGYRIHLCKGEYFRVSNRHRGKLTHLVYPAPTPISLGTHAVLGLDGSLRLGPNAFFVQDVNYDVDPAHREEFCASSREFLPFIEAGDLTPDQAGIRPKLQTEKESFHDFVVREESDGGLPGLIDLIGIESPGLTAATAIAGMVAEIVE